MTHWTHHEAVDLARRIRSMTEALQSDLTAVVTMNPSTIEELSASPEVSGMHIVRAHDLMPEETARLLGIEPSGQLPSVGPPDFACKPEERGPVVKIAGFDLVPDALVKPGLFFIETLKEN